MLPTRRLVLPADLAGVKNGQLPNRLLTHIQPSGRLHHKAARAWAALQIKALEERLSLVHVGDYRPLSQQEELFKARMRPFPDAKRTKQVTRTWKGQTWFLHFGAPVATPGTSNHGFGLAIDAALRLKSGEVVNISNRPKAAKRSGLDFLLEWGPRLGWTWELQVEPWHIVAHRVDKEPALVKEVLGA